MKDNNNKINTISEEEKNKQNNDYNKLKKDLEKLGKENKSKSTSKKSKKRKEENKKQMKTGAKKPITLKTLTKSSVWDANESDILRVLEEIGKDADARDNMRHYASIIKSAFDLEQIENAPTVKSKYEKMGYKTHAMRKGEDDNALWAVKKRPIVRVTDLTYENIHHISAAKLTEVLDRNFGGGWDSLSQSIKDIIESGFDISTTTLPKDRLHKPGGMYEKKVADGFDVLEVAKGTWVEAIFVKLKPEMEKPRVAEPTAPSDEEEDEPEDTYNKPEEDDMEPEEPTDFSDEMTEENYRTTFDVDGDPDEEAENISDYGEE